MVGLIPALQTAFSIVPLTLGQWGIVALCSISIIPAVEISKFFMHHKFGGKKKTIEIFFFFVKYYHLVHGDGLVDHFFHLGQKSFIRLVGHDD